MKPWCIGNLSANSRGSKISGNGRGSCQQIRTRKNESYSMSSEFESDPNSFSRRSCSIVFCTRKGSNIRIYSRTCARTMSTPIVSRDRISCRHSQERIYSEYPFCTQIERPHFNTRRKYRIRKECFHTSKYITPNTNGSS